jgi:hypothetical protein
VNSFFYKTDETGFRPTFFVVEDNKVMEENTDRIRSYEVPYKFFPTDYKDKRLEAPNTFFFRMNQGYYKKSSPNYCVPRFSTDASKVVYCGQSVTYINLQLAFFMGFTEVYLIGMDFHYVIPESHKRKGNHIISTTDDPNHFHKDYFGKGKTWKDPKLYRVAMNYRQAKLVYEAVGRKICNATIGGKLEIFDRVDYEALLREPKTNGIKAKLVAPIVTATTKDAFTQAPMSVVTSPAATTLPTGIFATAKRPFYAPFGDWLKWRSPYLFRVLRFSRRAAVDLRHGRLTTIAESIRERSRVLFRLGQFVVWSMRVVRRHPAVSAVLLLTVVLLAALPAYEPLWPYRSWLWAGATLTGLAGAGIVLFAVMNKALQKLLDKQAGQAATAIRAANQTKEQILTEMKKLKADLEAVKKTSQTVDTALKAELRELMRIEISALRTVIDRDMSLSNYGNASALRAHSRKLSEAEIEHIRKYWLKLFGLSLSGRQLSYIAHQICLAEERCEGRMATTIQAAMLRTLALLSLQSKTIELLEIGTLFGIAVGSLYRAGIRAQREVSITLIDPLEGYYDQGLTDAHTGVPVTRGTLVSNLAALGVNDKHYRIIQHLSTDPEAVKAASDRRYDYVLVDGDHSLEGVAGDFDIYGPLVKPGGLLIFDDYDTTDWPAIKPFVDEHVLPNEDWLFIGSDWRTAIFRRRRREAIVQA